MPRNLPPFSAVKAFEAAARHGSFARAAGELDVTATAISQHVKSLEIWLGASLFVRRANGVLVTEKGAALLADVTRILDELAVLLPPQAPVVKSDQVTLAAPVDWLDGWFAPRLEAFEQLHPGISVHMKTVQDNSRLDREPNVDFLISNREASNRDLLSDHLLDDALIPVCTRQYRDLLGLQDPFNWKSVTLLHITPYEGDWQRWADQQERAPEIDWQKGSRFPNHWLAIEAAKQGRGILIAHRLPVAEALAEETLVTLFDKSTSVDASYHLIRRRGHNSPAAIQLRAWIFGSIRGLLAEK